jgi:hypothetical protein
MSKNFHNGDQPKIDYFGERGAKGSNLSEIWDSSEIMVQVSLGFIPGKPVGYQTVIGRDQESSKFLLYFVIIRATSYP